MTGQTLRYSWWVWIALKWTFFFDQKLTFSQKSRFSILDSLALITLGLVATGLPVATGPPVARGLPPGPRGLTFVRRDHDTGPVFWHHSGICQLSGISGRGLISGLGAPPARYGTVRYGTVRYGTVRYGTVRCGALRECAMRMLHLF